MKRVLMVGVALLATACGGEEVEQDRPFVPSPGSVPPDDTGPIPDVAQEYDPSLNVDLAAMAVTPGGVRFRDLVVGSGIAAAPGHRIQTRYVGRLPNGELFDAGDYPPPGGGPLVLGTRSVIRGWDEGLVGMRVGGRRQLVIPPELGYGESGSGMIPGGATLVFEIELLAAGN